MAKKIIGNTTNELVLQMNAKGQVYIDEDQMFEILNRQIQTSDKTEADKTTVLLVDALKLMKDHIYHTHPSSSQLESWKDCNVCNESEPYHRSNCEIHKWERKTIMHLEEILGVNIKDE